MGCHGYDHSIFTIFALGNVAVWSKVQIAVPWPLIVGSTLPLAHISSGSYHGYFMSSFNLYISFHLTLWVACVPLESPSAYNIYLFNLRIANHILIIKRFFKLSCFTWPPLKISHET